MGRPAGASRLPATHDILLYTDRYFVAPPIFSRACTERVELYEVHAHMGIGHRRIAVAYHCRIVTHCCIITNLGSHVCIRQHMHVMQTSLQTSLHWSRACHSLDGTHMGSSGGTINLFRTRTQHGRTHMTGPRRLLFLTSCWDDSKA